MPMEAKAVWLLESYEKVRMLTCRLYNFHQGALVTQNQFITSTQLNSLSAD